MMDVAMALATLFFVLLLVSSAAISLLLLRLCLAAIRPSTTTQTYSPAGADPESLAPPVPPPPLHPHELSLLPAPRPTKEPKEQWTEPRRLAWREVEALTGGFDEAAVVGRGGSGNTVYGVRFDGSPAAVKVHRWCGGGERRVAAFRRELDLLRRVGRHPRLVALLAYSDDHGKKIVYTVTVWSFDSTLRFLWRQNVFFASLFFTFLHRR